jgi:hypothetical protein
MHCHYLNNVIQQSNLSLMQQRLYTIQTLEVSREIILSHHITIKSVAYRNSIIILEESMHKLKKISIIIDE